MQLKEYSTQKNQLASSDVINSIGILRLGYGVNLIFFVGNDLIRSQCKSFK